MINYLAGEKGSWKNINTHNSGVSDFRCSIISWEVAGVEIYETFASIPRYKNIYIRAYMYGVCIHSTTYPKDFAPCRRPLFSLFGA